MSHQRRTLRADGAEQFRMSKCKAQRAVAAHRNSRNTSKIALPADLIFSLDERQELVQEKIAVTLLAIGRIDIKSASAFRRCDQEFAYLVLSAQFFDLVPRAALKQALFVVTQSMLEIKHWIASGRVSGCGGVII